jgi:molybdenum cofactor cytidylyltransferase
VTGFEQAAPGALRFAVNRRWAAGMAGSVRAGVRAVSPGAAAVVIALGDQPGIAPGVVDRLIAAYREAAGEASSDAEEVAKLIVAPSYRVEGGRERGNPVLFDRSLFPELLRLRGDEGARRVIARDAGRVLLVDFPFPPPPDIDTAEDYRRLLSARRR